MAKEIDKLKKRLKIDKMDIKSRKELFNKFIEKGGKVVKTSKKSSSVIVDREKQKEFLKKIEKNKNKLKKRYSSRKRLQDLNKQQSNVKKDQNNSIFLKLRGVFVGSVSLFSGKISQKTFDIIKNVIQDCFVSLSYVGSQILHPKKGGITWVKKELIKKTPLSYEFLVRMEDLYNENDFNNILTPYEKNNRVKIKPYQIKEPIKNIFKKLFLFYTYENTIIESVTDGLEVMSKVQNLSRDFIETMLIKTKTSLKVMYSPKIFDKVFLLYCLSCGTSLYLNNYAKILNAIGISADEIGSIAEKAKEDIESAYKIKFGSKIFDNISEENSEESTVLYEKIDEEEKEQEEKLDEEIPEEYLIGKELFDSLNLKIPDKSSTSRYKYFKPDDKMFYTIKAFDFFDKEFSLLLSQNKISYSVDYLDGKKIDLRSRLSQIYVNLTTCRDSMDEYIKIIEQIYGIEADNRIGINKKFSIMNNYQIRQTKISLETRNKLLGNMQELVKLLEYSIDNKSIIDNDKKLYFDEIDGNRVLEGKTNIEAVKVGLSFVRFFAFMLEKGYLSGTGPTIKN